MCNQQSSADSQHRLPDQRTNSAELRWARYINGLEPFLMNSIKNRFAIDNCLGIGVAAKARMDAMVGGG